MKTGYIDKAVAIGATIFVIILFLMAGCPAFKD